MRIAVIMSGGRGTRFWPLSRARKPKQLVPLLNGRCLLDLTIERIRPLFEPDAIWVVTRESQLEETQAAVGIERVKALCEPVGKNTAPCMAYVSCRARAEFGDATLAVFPADHVIEDVEGFRRVIGAGMEFVEQSGSILTIGIKPGRPATGFGYIERGEAAGRAAGLEFYRVRRFIEKPAAEAASRLAGEPRYLWNAGIFVFRASDMLAEMAEHMPAMAASFCEYQAAFGTGEEERKKSKAYSSASEMSIDVGVMEKTQRACVVPADIGWDDVGSWDSFARYLPCDGRGNSVMGDLVAVDTANCIVYSDRRVVAALGVEDLIVIATDDAVLVARRERGEDVRKLVDRLEAGGFRHLL